MNIFKILEVEFFCIYVDINNINVPEPLVLRN
jgi:hypothetical protein